MKEMMTMPNIFIAGVLTILIFLINEKKIIIDILGDLTYKQREDKYITKYGRFGRVYAMANKKKYKVDDILIIRDNIIKFYVPSKETYVEGIFIGIDEDGIMYIRRDPEDVVAYEVSALKREDIIYVKTEVL